MRKIVERVPADSSSSWLGGFPFYNGFGGGGNPFGGVYSYPGWYGEEPPLFGYHQQPRRLPRHPFGFRGWNNNFLLGFSMPWSYF
ncbi:hypothetical protein BUALT_Bualt06G0039100 [Buddleja alternifolia]|uniref:Spore coat protein n=1 Tax=Buddleja alternifolia TaxID=168488 RepID=A0AAV6XCT2_9LAMI|nr:hypothetical protein BUALT_Bualt06G0039100 [Buddleja alternifolia]